MNKRKVVEKFCGELRAQFDLLRRASATARTDATDEESRARSKYDTQGLEASYLAAGQADRAEGLAATIATFSATPFLPFNSNDAIAEGALVETLFDRERSWFLLSPCAGGMTIDYEGAEITVLGPGAPLRRQLQGLKAGDRLKQPSITIKSVS